MIQSYPWYISDWRQDEAVLAMTAEQQGIYRNLLDMCWDIGDLPTGEKALIGLALCSEREWKRSWPGVRAMFFELDGRLHNKKVDAKRPEILRSKEDRKRGAQITNAKRSAQRPPHAERDAERSLVSDAERTPPPSPSPSPSPCSAKASLPPSAAETREPPDLSSFSAELRNQFPANRRGALVQVEQAVSVEFGPLPEDRLLTSMATARANLTAYLASDEVRRGVCCNAARWIADGRWQVTAEPLAPTPRKLTAVDRFKAEMGIHNAL